MKSDFLMNVAWSGVQQLDLSQYPTSETKTAENFVLHSKSGVADHRRKRVISSYPTPSRFVRSSTWTDNLPNILNNTVCVKHTSYF